MYGNPTYAEVQEAMQMLRARGVATVKIEFSGGNDEGGADDFDFFDAEGNNMVDVATGNASDQEVYDRDAGKWVSKGWQVSSYVDGQWTSRPATDDEIAIAKVTRVLEYPIYDCYGSFAGEFEVCGTLTWDVTKGTHEMHGNESYTSWKSF